MAISYPPKRRQASTSEQILIDAPPAYQALNPVHKTSSRASSTSSHISQRVDSSASDTTSLSSRSSAASYAKEIKDEQHIGSARTPSWNGTAAPYSNLSAKLPLPIAIPQTIPGLCQPFARVYAPELVNHSISPEEFVDFIDNLNIISTSNTPLQVLDLAGAFVSHIPLPLIGLVGNGIRLGAKAATVAIAKDQVALYMVQSNKTLFAPRGLVARITDCATTAQILNMPNSGYNKLSMVEPLSAHNATLPPVERRLATVRPYTCQVITDVPPPVRGATAVSHFSAGQVAKTCQKNDREALKARAKAIKKHGVYLPDVKDGKGSCDGSGPARMEVLGRDREMKRGHKGLWIVIENI